MISLDGASFLLQWATGGLLFLWVTTRRREVGLGYGWLLRGVYRAHGARARSSSARFVIEPSPVRDAASLGVALAAARRPGGVDRAAQGRGVRVRRAGRGAHGPGGGHDRHRPGCPTEKDDGARVPAGARPASPRSSASSASSAAGDRPTGRRRLGLAVLRASSSAPPSSARSPTPCCSATGTSCSPGWPGRRCSSSCGGLGDPLRARGAPAARARRA